MQQYEDLDLKEEEKAKLAKDFEDTFANIFSTDRYICDDDED